MANKIYYSSNNLESSFGISSFPYVNASYNQQDKYLKYEVNLIKAISQRYMLFLGEDFPPTKFSLKCIFLVFGSMSLKGIHPNQTLEIRFFISTVHFIFNYSK